MFCFICFCFDFVSAAHEIKHTSLYIFIDNRGLAAIPLLCAAAAESRSAYLARLQVTHPSNGVRRITRVCFV